jgi:hypothetical protein
VVVFALLAMLGIMTAVGAQLVRPPSPLRTVVEPEASIAPYMLPTPTQHATSGRVLTAHRALHALGRACRTPILDRAPASMSAPLAVLEDFAKEYPEGGFSVDDEPGSTLALMIVVANELKTCDPSRVREIQDLIPTRYRGD